MNKSQAAHALAGRRILVGPNDIASIASRMAVALAAHGAQVVFFNANEHAFYAKVEESANLHHLFGRAIGLTSRWKDQGNSLQRLLGSLLARLIKLAAFLKTCLWAQTVIMIGGKGFFGGAVEYRFLRALGKRVIHVFVGTASRPRYLSGYAKGVVKGNSVNEKELQSLARRIERQARRIRGISRHASLVVENPLCGHFHERAFVNWFKLGAPLDVTALEQIPRITNATPPCPEGKIRVLHCPSRPEIKGSARIQAVMQKLIQEGLPLEFRQLTGVPRAQVLHEITQCDFVIDELYSDSPLAGFAAEASAFGKAAIVGGYGWKLFPAFLQPAEMPPTPICHPDELEQLVRDLAFAPAQRAALGQNARNFLQNCWSEAGFAERFAQVVTGTMPAEWWIKPEQVQYMHGLGLDETEAQQLIGALVKRFGPGSLQVDHIPELRDRFVAFGTGKPAGY